MPVRLKGFIRGLLENVGPQIDPQRLIRRIRNGLEIPGLKEALIKILWDFNLQVRSLYALVMCVHVFRLQISLLEGCQRVLHSDISKLSHSLQVGQTSSFHGNRK